MKLSLQGIQNPAYRDRGYLLPRFDIAAMRRNTAERPTWLHFGAGNILRAFPAVLCQRLLESGDIDTGLCVVECYDEEIITKAYAPYDNLSLAVSLKLDGTVDKRVVASVAEAMGYAGHIDRVRELMTAPTLQMVTLTITEKGYAVRNAQGEPLPFCAGDFACMDAPASIIGKLAYMLHERYRAGAAPLAMVSLDNCSHNGSILQASINAIAEGWLARGLVEPGFLAYLNDPARVAFTWSMIDKITPRPSEKVLELLARDGFEGAEVTVTARNTYVSAMVNAEECEYLAIEDRFPNGRPPLQKVDVIFGDRDTVDRIEKMKVCTCLNPLHTSLGTFGCLLGIPTVAAAMRDPTILALVRRIGYDEGMPVVVDPGVMSARAFLDEVVERRFPNPFMPDTPQRLVCDNSKKIPVRFGETLKAYVAAGKTDLRFLTCIPLTFAGYARYLTGINDQGQAFERSPDPNLEALSACLAGYELGQPFDTARLRPLFSNADVFGVDLYAVNLGETCERMFAELSEGPGAVRATLERYVK